MKANLGFSGLDLKLAAGTTSLMPLHDWGVGGELDFLYGNIKLVLETDAFTTGYVPGNIGVFVFRDSGVGLLVNFAVSRARFQGIPDLLIPPSPEIFTQFGLGIVRRL